jgi:hypothetical protein
MAQGSKPGERRGGRKKGTPNKVSVSIAIKAQEYSDLALATIVDAVTNADTWMARLGAAKEILDRGHGRPTMTLEQTIIDKTAEERLARLRELLA